MPIRSINHNFASLPKVIFKFPTFQMLESDYLARLPVETLNTIMTYLSDDEQKNLSQTCKWLFRIVRKYKFGFVAPFWEIVNYGNVDGVDSDLIASNYRD
ncbi:6367_t:CDS:1, partial [Acaulospora morrowiae]